jgi:HD-GYP domain-containing protein (c-di-GMP phosphodiesterase class II)
MPERLSTIRNLRLRNLVLVFLLTYGSLPLVIAALATVSQNRRLVETQEQISLTHRVEALSGALASRLESGRRRLAEIGTVLVSIPRREMSPAVRDRWVDDTLRAFAARNADLLYTDVLLLDEGREFGPSDVPAPIRAAMASAIDAALQSGVGSTRFFALAADREPAAIVTEVATRPGRREPAVILAGLVRLPFRPEGQTMTFLLDVRGDILWAEKPDAAYEQALHDSTLVEDFVRRPSVFVSEHWLEIGARKQRMIAQVSPIGDVGWGLVVQQPQSEAFGIARQVVNSTLISALLMLVLALVFAVGASQLFSRPIQRLASTSAEIAAGNFGGRVSETGFSRELGELARNFNVMSGHVEESIARLRRAAEENHLLFVGSIRALLAAVEAKEPYTRGHSERVAAYSQAIARHLELSPELQEQIWVAGLVHDVGKIGIDDRILKKGNALTEDEFDAIKRHPIIGEEIMAPIEQLSYSLPAIRWHHEKWNGRGYPDGLRREAIPLPARIVSVADSFDAMTTQRVYQEPLSPPEAVAWIRQQNGVSFDARVVEAFMRAYVAGEIKPPESSELERPRPALRPAAAAVGESVYT